MGIFDGRYDFSDSGDEIDAGTGVVEFDFENYKPKDVDDKERYERARKLAIDNEVKLSNLVERKQVQGVIAKYAELIQTHFVNLPRREASNLAAILSVEGREKEIQEFLGKAIEGGLVACREELKKTLRKRTWK